MKWILSMLLAVCVVSLATSQIKAVQEFLDDHPDLKKYYVYQSTLRMVNQDGNEDFNRLIKDIRKINVYVAEGNSDITKTRYDQIIDDLYQEEFEILINAKYEGSTYVHMMSRDHGGRSYYVLTVRDEDNFALMEMDGTLDLKYIQALENMNFEELVGMVIKENDKESDNE